MGHGRTADLPSRQFSYAQMAEDTAALLAQLGVESVDVVGMSDGGIVGYLLAINHPSLVRRLVTSGSNVDGEGLPPPKTGEVKPEQLPKMFHDDYEKLSPDGEAIAARRWNAVLLDHLQHNVNVEWLLQQADDVVAEPLKAAVGIRPWPWQGPSKRSRSGVDFPGTSPPSAHG